MKLKTRTLLLLVPLLLAAQFSFGQAEKTLVKAFNLMDNPVVLLDLEGNVEVQQWKQPQLRIQMTISLQNGTEVVLKSLVQAGRYNLNSEDTGTALKIYAPGLEKPVLMRNGQDLIEKISYIVYAPENVNIRFSNLTSSATGLSNSTTSSF
jgi:hypothetical protein